VRFLLALSLLALTAATAAPIPPDMRGMILNVAPTVPPTPPTPPPTGAGYPHLATGFIGNIAWNSSTNTAWTNWLAVNQMNIVSPIAGSGSYSGLNMYGGSFGAAVMQVKALASANSLPFVPKVVQYYLTDSLVTGNTSFPNGLAGPYNKAQSFPNYWLWQNGNTQTTHATNGGYTFANQTIGVLPGGSSQLLSGGLNWEQWNAQYAYNFWITGTATNPAPASSDVAPGLDGLYHDNAGTIPGCPGDYAFTGTNTATSDANFQKSYGLGLGTGATWLTSNTGLLMLGNIGAWYTAASAAYPTVFQAGTFNGGLLEGAIGTTYGPDWYQGTGTASSPTGAWSQYAGAIANSAATNYVIVGHLNLNSNGSDSNQSTAYAAMRYGLTLALQNNGYYFASSGTGYSFVVLPFDEYFVNPSTGVAVAYSNAANVAPYVQWMGVPTSTWGTVAGTGASQTIGGLNVRMFYNATAGTTWVAINSPHGAATLSGGGSISATSLHAGSAGFKHINGTQSSVNNGATVSSLSFSTGYDGVIVQLL
jgi:hypothetical protein